jgi:hypothetical protein
MRTTVAINDDLLAKAKATARRRSQTLGQFLEDAIRVHLAGDRALRDIPPLPVMEGTGGMNPAIDPTSNAAMQEFLDEDLPFEKLR